MGCKGCTVGKNGAPAGCGSKGNCMTGGCNRLNAYDWLSRLDISDPEAFDIIEVSFKNGARKNFYKNHEYNPAITGDMVVVECSNGYDVGHVTLSGDLVRLQMKKKKFSEEKVLHSVIRRANDRDVEKLDEARKQEQKTMVRARAIARTLDLEMKIGDVEYQGDKRKATFYYTADGRVDFRELIRHYAREFKVKIEMRQIGSRQESARIGGIGSCGRELCCSTWLTDFKSVSTTAARYQNLAINQAKLSGQCGRLKCCLNYELDTYLDALESFPEHAETLQTEKGNAKLIKTDIFKQLMYYSLKDDMGRNKVYALHIDKVKSIKEMIEKGEKPQNLEGHNVLIEVDDDTIDFDDDVTGVIELPTTKKKKKRNRGRNRGRGGDNRSRTKNPGNNNQGQKKDGKEGKESNKKTQNKRRKPDNKRKKK